MTAKNFLTANEFITENEIKKMKEILGFNPEQFLKYTEGECLQYYIIKINKYIKILKL